MPRPMPLVEPVTRAVFAFQHMRSPNELRCKTAIIAPVAGKFSMNEPTLNYVPVPMLPAVTAWPIGPGRCGGLACDRRHGLSRQGRISTCWRPMCWPAPASRCARDLPRCGGARRSDWLATPWATSAAVRGRHAGAAGAAACRADRTLDWVGTSMGGLIGMALAGQPGLPLPVPCGGWCSTTWGRPLSGRRCSASAVPGPAGSLPTRSRRLRRCARSRGLRPAQRCAAGWR
jgi:hypothetical protein